MVRTISLVEFKGVPSTWDVYNRLYDINISEIIQGQIKNHAYLDKEQGAYVVSPREEFPIPIYFNQDIVQISTPVGIIIDVGWYPDASPKGCFVCLVVKDYCWDKPLEKKKYRTWQSVQRWVDSKIKEFKKIDE